MSRFGWCAGYSVTLDFQIMVIVMMGGVTCKSNALETLMEGAHFGVYFDHSKMLRGEVQVILDDSKLQVTVGWCGAVTF